jgi:hypothetical protein
MNHTMSNAGFATSQCVKFTHQFRQSLEAQASILQISNPTRRSEQDLC